MRVLYVVNSLTPGGAESTLAAIVRAMKARGHDVTVAVLESGGSLADELAAAGVNVVSLAKSRIGLLIFGVWRLVRLVRTERPDVIQSWLYHADLLAAAASALTRSTLIWGVRHADAGVGTKKSTAMVLRASAVVSHYVPKAIVCASFRAVDSHRAAGYCARKLVCIQNSVNGERFKPNHIARKQIRADLGCEQSSVLVGLVARWHPDKNVLLFIDSVAEMKARGLPIIALLAGRNLDGGNDTLRQEISRRGLETTVHLLGFREDIPQLLCALDALVLTSDTESFPNVLVQALACGTPCVSTDVGDARIMIGDWGEVVEAPSAERIAAAVARQVSRWRADSALAGNARNWVISQFDTETALEKYEFVYNTQVESRQPPPSADTSPWS